MSVVFIDPERNIFYERLTMGLPVHPPARARGIVPTTSVVGALDPYAVLTIVNALTLIDYVTMTHHLEPHLLLISCMLPLRTC